MTAPRISVIEVTFEDGSSDTIQLYPQQDDFSLYGWTRRRIGKKLYRSAYTMTAIAAYLYETAFRGEASERNRFDDYVVKLEKAYRECGKARTEN